MPILFCVFVFLMTLSRVIPHPPDLTPTLVLSLLLPQIVSTRMAVVIFMVGQGLSDILLSFLYHYPVWGNWSFFVYSGFIFSILFFRFNLRQAIFATFLFWVWTNFGVFLLSGIYLHTINGLILCYVLALPFLGSSVIATMFYYGLVWIAALDRGYSNRVFFTAL